MLHRHLVVGGTERVLITTLELLNQLGHQVDLLLTYDLGDENFFINQIPSAVNYSFVFSQKDHYLINQERLQLLANRKNSLRDKSKYELFKFKEQQIYNNKLKNLIQQNNYHLIIDFSGCLDKFIRLPRWMRGNTPPTVRWVHGQLFNPTQPISAKLFKRYSKVFHRHNRVVSICEEMMQSLSSLFKLPSKKLATLHNPINLEEIQSKANDTSPIAEIDAIKPYILQVARLDIGKGHEELIDIYNHLKKQGIKHKLCIIGDGENRAKLEEKIKYLNLENDCLLLGKRSNPYPYFKHADVFVHTSEHEGLPTVLLESMACATPVVAMDCPTGPKDILGANNQYGCLIPMHDKEKFAEAIIQLLSDSNIYEMYCQKSLLRANDFSMQHIGIELNKLLNDIVQNP